MMALTGTRTYVGFGFGPIQAGLFLYEAYASGSFHRLVVGHRRSEVVNSVRRAGGMYSLNIAYADRVECAAIGPIEIENMYLEADQKRLVEAIAQAEEIGMAVTSVEHYVLPRNGSLQCLLAEGLREKARKRGPRTIVYAAENHNQAAEILESKVFEEIPLEEQDSIRSRVRFLNTVIGKMSGTISDPDQIRTNGLVTITPEDKRAFLVEAFNRILISQIQFDATDVNSPYQRGILVLEEKPNLLPFEEAKLFGHNATHALAAYVGAILGVERIAELRNTPGILPFLRAAFIQESGEALVRKHGGLDPLFTREGYQRYADDLLDRMTNPHLLDSVRRVGRDPERKLGWNDRLVGTMRMTLQQGVDPQRYAFGAAAALASLDSATLESDKSLRTWLYQVWGRVPEDKDEGENVINLIENARRRLRGWRESGCPHLGRFFVNR